MPPLDDVELLELLELLDVLELLPHAASPSASTIAPASAPNLVLITTSPLAGLRVESGAGPVRGPRRSDAKRVS